MLQVEPFPLCAYYVYFPLCAYCVYLCYLPFMGVQNRNMVVCTENHKKVHAQTQYFHPL